MSRTEKGRFVRTHVCGCVYCNRTRVRHAHPACALHLSQRRVGLPGMCHRHISTERSRRPGLRNERTCARRRMMRVAAGLIPMRCMTCSPPTFAPPNPTHLTPKIPLPLAFRSPSAPLLFSAPPLSLPSGFQAADLLAKGEAFSALACAPTVVAVGTTFGAVHLLTIAGQFIVTLPSGDRTAVITQLCIVSLSRLLFVASSLCDIYVCHRVCVSFLASVR